MGRVIDAIGCLLNVFLAMPRYLLVCHCVHVLLGSRSSMDEGDQTGTPAAVVDRGLACMLGEGRWTATDVLLCQLLPWPG